MTGLPRRKLTRAQLDHDMAEVNLDSELLAPHIIRNTLPRDWPTMSATRQRYVFTLHFYRLLNRFNRETSSVYGSIVTLDDIR